MRTSPLSTEARIFAKDVLREVNRREKLGAPILAGRKSAATWGDASSALGRYIVGDASPVKTAKIVLERVQQLQKLDSSDRGFVILTWSSHGRRAHLDVRTMTSGLHPLVGVDNERGVMVEKHLLMVGRQKNFAMVGLTSAHMSEHAISRMFERSHGTAVAGMVGVIALAGVVADIVCGRPSLRRSEINIGIGDVILSGSLRTANMTLQGGSSAVIDFLDIRTVLPVAWCTEMQRQQAAVLTVLARKILDQEVEYPLSADYAADVPFIARREDFVTLSATR